MCQGISQCFIIALVVGVTLIMGGLAVGTAFAFFPPYELMWCAIPLALAGGVTIAGAAFCSENE
jgi:Na+/citrate or Na+/malate symporter